MIEEKSRARLWLRLRWVILTSPFEFRATVVWKSTPWYARAYPVSVIQHWAPDVFSPVTFCGRLVEEASSGRMRTLLGWHCRRCTRRAVRSKRRVLAQRAAQTEGD